MKGEGSTEWFRHGGFRWFPLSIFFFCFAYLRFSVLLCCSYLSSVCVVNWGVMMSNREIVVRVWVKKLISLWWMRRKFESFWKFQSIIWRWGKKSLFLIIAPLRFCPSCYACCFIRIFLLNSLSLFASVSFLFFNPKPLFFCYKLL